MFAFSHPYFPALTALCAAALLAGCGSTPTAAPAAPVAQATPRPAAAPAPASAPVYVAPPAAPVAPPVVYTPPPAPVIIQQNASPAQGAPIASAGATALREGLAAYQKRDYRTAETKLAQSQEQGLSQFDEVVQATKTQAFIYCQSKRTAKCEEAFTELLSLEPTYNLSSSERNPAWTATFAKVKNRMRK